MALYKNASIIAQSDDAAFDALQSAGFSAPVSGIYRCEGCGYEVVASQGHSLPPQTHHRHSPDIGPIRWRLAVFAEHRAPQE